ncbi:MAG: hypothetical protein AB1778_05880 [Candidatus Bipolaricaulota bacterium]
MALRKTRVLLLALLAAASAVGHLSAEPDEMGAWVQSGGPPGGGLGAVEVDPILPDILYAGGADGRIFRSEDGGDHWKQLAVPMAGGIAQIIASPFEAGTLFLRMAESPFLVKGTSHGDEWSLLAFASADDGIRSLAISTASPALIVVGTRMGRVYTSSDHGKTWTDVSTSLNPGLPVVSVAARESGEIWAATQDGSGNGQVFYSLDFGESWSSLPVAGTCTMAPESDYLSVMVDPTEPSTVYVGRKDLTNLTQYPDYGYLYRIDTEGFSCTPIDPPGQHSSTQGVHFDETSGTLYVARGMDVFYTTDRGESWAVLPLPIDFTYVDPQELATDPRSAGVVYLATKATGIGKTTDQGVTWIQVNEGIVATAVTLIEIPPGDASGTVYATGGPALWKSETWGQAWTQIDRPDITHPFFDEIRVNPHDTDEVWAVTDVGHIFVSDTGGATWVETVDPTPSGRGFRYGSIYALAVSPSTPDVMYALKSGFGLYRSDTGGGHWLFLRNSEVDYSYSIAVHPTDPDVVLSGYNPKPFQNESMIRRSEDGGLTWSTPLTVEGSSGMTSVVFDPTDPTRVYAASTGTGGGTLWRSLDGGRGFEELDPHLNFTNIHTMTADAGDPEIALAAVWGGGTFYTRDAGVTWQRLPNEPTISASSVLTGFSGDALVLYLADRTSPRIYKSTAPWAGEWETLFDGTALGLYRVLAAAKSSSEPAVIYASLFHRQGGPMSGSVYRIENGRPPVDITAGLPPRLPVALTVDPTDPETVYAVLHGYGVYKTADGGDSWVELSGAGSRLPQPPETAGFSGLVVDPWMPDTLYLFGGCDVEVDLSRSGVASAKLNTVYRSTDAGATWDNLDDGHFGANSGPIKGLTVMPGAPDVMFVGAAHGVFRSLDGGRSWEAVHNGLPFLSTAGVWMSARGTEIYVPTLGGGLFVGAVGDGGRTVVWAKESAFTTPIAHVQLTIDPSDSDTLYASAYPGGVFKSTDGGDSFSEQNFGLPSFEIDDPLRQGYYALALAPSDSQVAYLGLYGVGVYKSCDGTDTWVPANGEDDVLAGQPVTALIVSEQDARLVYVGTEDGVYRSSDGGTRWSLLSDPTLEAPIDVRTLAFGGGGALLIGTKGYEIFRYGGGTFVQLDGFGNAGAIWPIWDDRPLYQYTALAFHPTDPSTVILGTFPAGIFISHDAGQTYRESNVGWGNDGVFSVVFHPDDPETIFVGTYNGVNVSTDGGEHWRTLDNGWPEEQWVFSIAFDPADPDILYACSKNGENEGTGRDGFHGIVMKSIDGGNGWFEIMNGLDRRCEFYKIIADPMRPGRLYLATDSRGVLLSNDSGDTWEAWNTGLTSLGAGSNGNNVTDVLRLSADATVIYFGTSGSGVFWRMIDD